MATKCLLDVSLSNNYLQDLRGNGTELRFRVQGESRIVAIFSSLTFADKIARELLGIYNNDSRNGTLKTKCTPITPYESFAKTSLGVSDIEVKKKGATPAFDPEKETYWLQVDIGYEGHTLEELRQAWHDEAVAALGLVHGGQVPIVIYKSVFMKQVHLFIQMDGAELDQLNFKLPLFKALGNQVKTTVRSVKVL